jgi:hypothetical protein
MKNCTHCALELTHQGQNTLDDWWSCSKCRMFYCYNIVNDFLSEVRFESKMTRGTYVLCLRYISKETRIIKLPVQPNDTLVDIYCIPEIVQGITPQNIKDKIKTYLVFS